MTPFSFEHVFRAPSVAAVFAAYFDPAHQREQDAALAIAAREILELTDDGATLRRVCHVRPRRQLPAVVRPFLAADGLSYVETATWRRADDQIDLAIAPALLGGRASITGLYTLRVASPGEVLRRYAGEVRVGVPLVSGRIERGIVAEFAASMPAAAAVTQRFLDTRGDKPLISRVSSGILVQ